MDITTISNLGGLLSLAITLLTITVGGFFLMRTGANTAQQSAITAMQAELGTLRSKIDDMNKENAKQGHIIETICIALKAKGIIITISGEAITIEDNGNNNSTTVRI